MASNEARGLAIMAFIGFLGVCLLFIAQGLKAEPKPLWATEVCETAACATNFLNSLSVSEALTAKVSVTGLHWDQGRILGDYFIFWRKD